MSAPLKIGEYDDVLLTRALPLTGNGNCSNPPLEVPSGTRATVIMLLDDRTRLFDLECYIGEHEFVFAQDTADNLRLLQAAEEKLRGNVREPEAAFDHGDGETMSPYDPRAEALARARGTPEDLIAMIKDGLEDIRAGRTRPSSEVFGDLAKKYGW